MVLLRIILIALLIYYSLKFIGRLIFPWLLSQAVNNPEVRKKYQNSGKKEGDVTVEDTAKDKNKVIDKDMGEYIDYEEIK